ncbi:hypothetical protein ACC755_37495, partial [Rhizobium ruizarguesonis]
KNDARLDLKLELQEGIKLVRSAEIHAGASLRAELKALVDHLERASDAERTAILLDAGTSELMNKAASLRSASTALAVERSRNGRLSALF